MLNADYECWVQLTLAKEWGNAALANRQCAASKSSGDGILSFKLAFSQVSMAQADRQTVYTVSDSFAILAISASPG